MSSSSAPRVRMLFRTKTAVELHSLGTSAPQSPSDSGDSSSVPPTKVTLISGPTSFHEFSPDGSAAYVHRTGVGVVKCDLSSSGAVAADSGQAFLEGTSPVQYLSVSPLGTYLVTWERPAKVDGSGEQPPPNLKVWSASDGTYLHGFRLKAVRREAFPPLRWTHDERYALYMSGGGEIHVYPGDGFANQSKGGGGEVRYVGRVRCPGASSFSVPPVAAEQYTDGKYFLTTFVPEVKGKPARVSMHSYPGGDVVASKSFYRAEECRVRWSPRGDAALAVTAAAVDSSGESYYGSADLYLLLGTDGKGGKAGTGGAISVPLPESATTCVDAQWQPNSTKPPSFAVISGKMPAQASLHHGVSGDPLHLLGKAHRNSISWSPHGRFLSLGGFGNLAGGMDFWDVNKKKTMAQSYDPVTGADTGARGNTANCAVGYGWSPDGRHFAVSTTSPRMNVDNGVRLYKYNGAEVLAASSAGVIGWSNDDYSPDKLLEAAFVPAPASAYPDRPQTPPPRKSAGAAASAATPAAAAAPAPAPAAYVPPAGRYVPPAARRGGGGGGTSLADRMRQERGGGGGAGGAAAGVAKAVKSAKGSGVVGMAPSSSEGGKTKSQIKREKAKAAKERAEKAAREEEERLAKAKEAKEKARQEANKADPEKRAKKIRKALKRIEELKGKDPGELDDDQRKKLETEVELREELAKLGV